MTTTHDAAEAGEVMEGEVARLKHEVLSLRAALGERNGAEPVGCPMPGACSVVMDIQEPTDLEIEVAAKAILSKTAEITGLGFTPYSWMQWLPEAVAALQAAARVRREGGVG